MCSSSPSLIPPQVHSLEQQRAIGGVGSMALRATSLPVGPFVSASDPTSMGSASKGPLAGEVVAEEGGELPLELEVRCWEGGEGGARA